MDTKVKLETYRDLLEYLSKQKDDTLDQTITLSYDNYEEFCQATVYIYNDDVVLDNGHLYVGIKEEESEN